MGIVLKHLADPVLLGTSNTSIFVNPDLQTSLIAGIIFHNFHTTEVEIVAWNRVPASGSSVGTPTLAYRILKYTLAPNETLTFRLPPINPYTEQYRALIATASVANVVTATVCGAIDNDFTYTVLSEPVLLSNGTGSDTSIIYPNPPGVKTAIAGFTCHNTNSTGVMIEAWHFVTPSSGSPGTPATNHKFFSVFLASNKTLTFNYPHPTSYADAGRSLRARASVASVVSFYATGHTYL